MNTCLVKHPTNVAIPVRFERNGLAPSWSRYNKLFHSSRFGYFVYNALSNALFELDEAHYQLLDDLRNHRIDYGRIDAEFRAELRRHYIVATSQDEQLALTSHRYKRDAKNFDSTRLGLTICPTLSCNFRCPYCFENSQADPTSMSLQTIDRLMAFISSYGDIRHLSLAWYGGEPLMGFDVIRKITEKIDELPLRFGGAALITNGYLMDRQKCDMFNDLQIHSVQVTLDGPERIHNKRRFVVGGGGTFQRILSNIDALLHSSFAGTCDIRVNVDRQNAESFLELQAMLLERFKDKRVCVYAARVTAAEGYDPAYLMDLREWTDFNYGLFEASGYVPAANFYPAINLESTCVATSHNRFVVGPRGELYKCWEDVGKRARVIGDVHSPEPITNPGLRAQYGSGTDAYADSECLECAVLPICGGGCANKRLRSKYFDERGLDYCSPFKDNLVDYLEAYIEIFMNMEMCTDILQSGDQRASHRYRNISPRTDRLCAGSGSCSQCS